MAVLRASFIAKTDRAEKHLVNLKAAINAYVKSNPYEVTERIERKRKVHRLSFTQSPANTDIPLILADGLYNLRGALDHLMAALVPSQDRTSVMFPIFWQGVWESPIEGENEDRGKARDRWITCIRSLPDKAVAILREMQPPDDAGQSDESANFTRDLNRLVNRDRHEKLPVTAAGLTRTTLGWQDPDGTAKIARGLLNPNSMVKDQAKFDIPADATNVQIKGTAVVVIDVGNVGAYRVLPDFLENGIRFVRGATDALIPYLHPVGGRKRRRP